MAEFNDFDWAQAAYGDAYIQSIFNFCAERNFKRGLEVGFDSGSSALAFLRACPDAELVSIEIAESVVAGAKMIQDSVPDWRERHMLLRSTDSRTFLPKLIEKGDQYDYVYIDGDHLYDAAKQDIENGWELLAPGGFMLVDDADPEHGHFGCGRAIYEFARAKGVQLTLLAGNPNHAVYVQKPL